MYLMKDSILNDYYFTSLLLSFFKHIRLSKSKIKLLCLLNLWVILLRNMAILTNNHNPDGAFTILFNDSL